MRGILLAALIANCSTAYGQFGLFSSEPPAEFMNAQISLGGFLPDYDEMTAIELITEIDEGFRGACDSDWAGWANTYTMICPWEEAGYEMQIRMKWDETRDLAVLNLSERTLSLVFPPYEARSLLERFPTTPETQAERRTVQERRDRLNREQRTRYDALPDYREIGTLCMDRMFESFRREVDALGRTTAESVRRSQELQKQFVEQRDTMRNFSSWSDESTALSSLRIGLSRQIGTNDSERFDQIEADYMLAYQEFEQAVEAISNGCRFVADP